jgi:hypothetical protein
MAEMPQTDQGAAASPSGGSPASGSPAAAPLSTPGNKEGEKMAAKLWVSHVAIPMMEKALVVLSSSTDEGKSILKALNALSKDFAGNGQDALGQSAIMQLMGNKQR